MNLLEIAESYFELYKTINPQQIESLTKAEIAPKIEEYESSMKEKHGVPFNPKMLFDPNTSHPLVRLNNQELHDHISGLKNRKTSLGEQMDIAKELKRRSELLIQQAKSPKAEAEYPTEEKPKETQPQTPKAEKESSIDPKHLPFIRSITKLNPENRKQLYNNLIEGHTQGKSMGLNNLHRFFDVSETHDENKKLKDVSFTPKFNTDHLQKSQIDNDSSFINISKELDPEQPETNTEQLETNPKQPETNTDVLETNPKQPETNTEQPEQPDIESILKKQGLSQEEIAYVLNNENSNKQPEQPEANPEQPEQPDLSSQKLKNDYISKLHNFHLKLLEQSLLKDQK